MDDQDFNSLKSKIQKVIDERYELEKENIELKLRILELEKIITEKCYG